MSLDTDGFDSLMTDIAGMASRMDADGAGAPVAKRILEAAAVPIYEQMKANASSDPKIITGVLNRSIQTGKVRKRRYSGRSITIGVHRKEEGAYYAPPVEYGHGGPAPAPAHPFRQFSLNLFPISAEKPGAELRHLGKQHIAGSIFRFVGNVQYFHWLLIWMRGFDVLGCHLVLFHFYGSSCVLAACPCRMKNDSVLHLRSPLTFLCRQGRISRCRAITAFIITYL